MGVPLGGTDGLQRWPGTADTGDMDTCPAACNRRCAAVPRSRGFTLIEAMITVAIIGILAAVAYPSYLDYIRKGKRATAQAALMDVASRQQTYLLDRRAYTDKLEDLGFVVPKEIQGDYSVTIDVPDPPVAFTARATPSAALQAKGEQTLEVNHLGVKSPANVSGYWTK